MNFHFLVHERPLPTPISQINPVYGPASHLLNIHSIIIFPSTPWFSKWFLSSSFHTKILYAPVLSPYVLHALPISFFLILLPKKYLVNSNHKALRYVVQYSMLRNVPEERRSRLHGGGCLKSRVLFLFIMSHDFKLRRNRLHIQKESVIT